MLGRFEFNKYQDMCSKCGNKADPFVLKNILASGYWPSSPRTCDFLFAQDLFLFWDQLRKHSPGSSEGSFLEVLNTQTEAHGRVSLFCSCWKNYSNISFTTQFTIVK